jgi:hypothetical protein
MPPILHAAAYAASLMLAPASLSAQESESCTVSGEPVMRSSAKLYLDATGGGPHARFTGGQVTLTAGEFQNSRTGRAKVRLAGFGLEGYVDLRDLPLFTTRAVPVYQGHVWIAEQREVVAIGSGPGKLQIQREVTFPMSQVFKAWAPCDAFTFTQRVASGWSPPGNARGYVAKESVELFDAIGGSNVTTLYPSDVANGILLWSSATERGWVHVEFHGDVILDAWTRRGNLRPLPHGETMDQLYPPTVRRGKPSLRLATEPRVVKKDSELTIRAKASETAPVIGKIAPGTELYLLDVVAGWASVLPKTLAVAPEGEEQFWVHAAELGL